jgi:ferredoxin
MLLLLFGFLGGRKGFVVYHALNPFNLFDLSFDEWLIPVTVIASLVLSLFLYRPFCYLICPFGFLSWLAERFSLARVRIDLARCTKCGTCVTACPSDAAQGRVQGKMFPADCTSCARCLNVCPHDLIRYGFPSASPVRGLDQEEQLRDGHQVRD